MNKILSFLFLIVLLPGFVTNVAGKSKYIVSAAELLKSKDKIVLLHIGQKKDFEREHIPGAQLISTRDVSTPRKKNRLILELPPVEQLKETFERYGTSNDTKIVLYW